MRVAISGFGRIGRVIFKIALDRKINIVAINDPHGAESARYLLEHDSIYGKYNKKINTKGNNLIVNNKKILVLSERDPSKLPWKKLKVDLVIDSTGAFNEKKDLSKHISSGAKKVIVTAPSKNPDITIVPGVNDKMLKKSDKIISVASCTTNCLATVTKVLNDKFGVKNELMTTIHAYTDSQNMLDSANKNVRRGRAGGLNLIPTTTGASVAVEAVLPSLKGKISGLAVRAPLAIVSLIDVVAELKKKAELKKIKSAFKEASKKKMKGILDYTEEELVSSDFIADPHSAIVDGKSIQIEGNLVKVLAWYDNEVGYSNRVVDVIKMLNWE